jgi:hypothetical protein
MVRIDYVVFLLRKVLLRGLSAAGESGRCKVWAWNDVRRSIDQHISVYLYDDHTAYRI